MADSLVQPPFRLALAQLNATVGDIAGNRDRIIQTLRCAEDSGAELVAFPELALTGYPPEDLLLKPSFIRDNLAALHDLAAATRDTVVVVAGKDPRSTGYLAGIDYVVLTPLS